jgi:hypothetical protein
MILRSDDAETGDAADAHFVLNWMKTIDKDVTYQVILESFLIEEGETPTGYTNSVLSLELGTVFPNVYDSLHNRCSNTLAIWKGLTYQGSPHLVGAQVDCPAWMLGSFNLAVKELDGTPATELVAQGAKWVATILLYPVS